MAYYCPFRYGVVHHQKTNQLPKRFQKLKNLTIYPANPKPKETISFKKDAFYGNTKKIEIGQIGDVAVDSSGRVFIADSQESTIDVFEPDGRFLTHLGRNGRGPGEFSYIKSLQISGNHLYVYDPNQQKESVFALHPLVLENTIILARNRDKYPALKRSFPWINNLFVRNNQTYLAGFMLNPISQKSKPWQNVKYKELFYLLNKDGNISTRKLFGIDITQTNFGGIVTNIKVLFGSPMTILSGNNNIYVSDEPDYFLIKIYSPKGAYLHAFYYPHPRIPLTKKSVSEGGITDTYFRHDFLLKNMKFMKLPPTWPVLIYMKIDNQDRLWFATVVKNMNVYQWWVLNPNGKLIARFIWPRSKHIKVIKNGNIYTKETDTTTGMSKIVRYRIEMKPFG